MQAMTQPNLQGATAAPTPLQIEDAIIDRLRQGLGQLVATVDSYRGELELAPAELSNRFPAAWVGLRSINSNPAGTGRERHKAYARFLVTVADRQVRPDPAVSAAPTPGSSGSYPLIYAVRRLLAGQDFGLAIQELQPGRVFIPRRFCLVPLTYPIYVCEFHTAWVDGALANGHWPCPESPQDQDALFARNKGRLDTPAGDWLGTTLNYQLDPQRPPAAQDQLPTRPQP